MAVVKRLRNGKSHSSVIIIATVSVCAIRQVPNARQSLLQVLSQLFTRAKWCRCLEIVDCGSATALVPGISALQNLQQLRIYVDRTLGSIGKLGALTSLDARVNDATHRPIELHLENPRLQILRLTASENMIDYCLVGVCITHIQLFMV